MTGHSDFVRANSDGQLAFVSGRRRARYYEFRHLLRHVLNTVNAYGVKITNPLMLPGRDASNSQ
jgi:hypothetical protein